MIVVDCGRLLQLSPGPEHEGRLDRWDAPRASIPPSKPPCYSLHYVGGQSRCTPHRPRLGWSRTRVRRRGAKGHRDPARSRIFRPALSVTDWSEIVPAQSSRPCIVRLRRYRDEDSAGRRRSSPTRWPPERPPHGAFGCIGDRRTESERERAARTRAGVPCSLRLPRRTI